MIPPLSLLDLASVSSGASHADALADTVATAQEAERLGYERVWVAEHHGMPAVASSAPAVLIAAIAAATTRIRVGAGGVMLPNHPSLVVAEQFGTLAALFGDRIDLGLGRAPGTDPVTASALRRSSVDAFPQQIVELLAYFGVVPPLDSGVGDVVTAVPGAEDAPQLWLLGSSEVSARLAGAMGLPFAFAHHFAGGDATAAAFEVYRRSFLPSAAGTAPRSMVSVATVVGADADDAARLALPQSLTAIRLLHGATPRRIPSLAEAEAYPWSDAERTLVARRNASQAIGDGEHVRRRLEGLVAETGADEVLVVPHGADRSTRVATLEAVAALR